MNLKNLLWFQDSINFKVNEYFYSFLTKYRKCNLIKCLYFVRVYFIELIIIFFSVA